MSNVFIELEAAINKGNFNQFKKIWEEEAINEFLTVEDGLFDPLNKSSSFQGKVFAPLFFSAIQGPNSDIAKFLLNLQGGEYGIPSVDITANYPIEVSNTDLYLFSFKKNELKLAFSGDDSAELDIVKRTSPLALAIKYRNFDLTESILKHYTKKQIAKAKDTFLFSFSEAIKEAIRADYSASSVAINTQQSYTDLLFSQFDFKSIQKYMFSFIDNELRDYYEKEGEDFAQFTFSHFYKSLEKEDLKIAVEFLNQWWGKVEKFSKLNFDLLDKEIKKITPSKLQSIPFRTISLVIDGKTVENRLWEVSNEEAFIVFQPCVLDKKSNLLTLDKILQNFEEALRKECKDHFEKKRELGNINYTIFLPFFSDFTARSTKASLAQITFDARDYPSSSLRKSLAIYAPQHGLLDEDKQHLSNIAKKHGYSYDPEKNYHESLTTVTIFQFICNKVMDILKMVGISFGGRSEDKSKDKSEDELTNSFRKCVLKKSPNYPGSAKRMSPEFFKIPNQNHENDKNKLVFEATLKI
ncbi:MAG: hypothetical protein REH83_04700 [Rickettsiella sp.]|nr:hypothetical protein [Rickettsiella sp.]